METTPTNNTFNQAAAIKKVWVSPTLEIVDRGYIAGGIIVGLHESTITPTHSQKGTQFS